MRYPWLGESYSLALHGLTKKKLRKSKGKSLEIPDCKSGEGMVYCIRG